MTHSSPISPLILQVVGKPNQHASKVAFSEHDFFVLSLLRFTFNEGRCKHPLCQRAALDLAEQRMLHDDAHLLTRALRQIVQEMSKVRSTNFFFLPGKDRKARLYVTPEEACFVNLVRALIDGDPTSIQAQLLMLCEGGDSATILRDARCVSDVMMRVQRMSKSA
ncbi:MAG: hypothetical protein MK098_07260 [Marinovum sp.]|nr:hypothetical protein [Marinovum sp.]